MNNCPLPIIDYNKIQIGHGGGGRLTNQLIEKLFLPEFRNSFLETRHDGAVIDFGNLKLAFTTDSYVIRPIFFPGGNIGTLAVNGTVNDLAMCGAKPLYLSVGFILEEGFPLEALYQVVQSMGKAARFAHVEIVTGDTKVVDKGKGDGIFINTAGIGVVESGVEISPKRVVSGDVVLLSGDIGRHGIAIMAVREGLDFETEIESDCAPVSDLTLDLLEKGVEIHALRDLTRGGLATALLEIAETSSSQIRIEEEAVPVREEVQGACEILGLDPLYVANEGRFAVFLPENHAQRALEIFHSYPLGKDACAIGRVVSSGARGMVTAKSQLGTNRILDFLSGEQLPRIC